MSSNEPRFSLAPSVVITGVGMVTSLGDSADTVWKRIAAGECGFGAMPALEHPLPEGHSGAQAVELPADFAPQLPREARYLRYALLQALDRAGLQVNAMPYASERCGIVLGTTLHGMRAGGQFFRTDDPSFLREFLSGATIQRATGDLPFDADAATTCSACSSSLGSVALAMTLLTGGELDLVIAGGYDAASEYAYAGFNSLRLVAPGPLRPFATSRLGMKLGEGYGVIVLEREEACRSRDAQPLARIRGWGESADAHHLTQPHPQGDGAASAIASALRCAQMQPSDIDLVAAHATGTPDNDAAESSALLRTFGDYPVQVVAFKSHLGHTLGGAGAVELILSALALRDQLVPGCANVDAREMEFPGLNVSLGAARAGKIRATLNCSLGFGGANTCVILTPAETPGGATLVSLSSSGKTGDTSVAPTADATTHAGSQPYLISDAPLAGGSPAAGPPASRHARPVLITGIGVVLPDAIGHEAFLARLSGPAQQYPIPDATNIPEDQYLHFLNARRVRRMSEYVKLTLAATAIAMSDAGVSLPSDSPDVWSAILGSTHGSSQYCHDYYKQIVNEGLAAANPMLFAEGVPNAAAAHLSLMLGIRGACQTIIGSRTAGLDALRLASLRIATGQWERAIVSAGEEYLDAVNRGYAVCNLYNPRGGGSPFADPTGYSVGCGGVTLVLESPDSAARRNARVRGVVASTVATRIDRDHKLRNAVNALSKLGPAPKTFSSANATWVDRFETIAIERSIGSTTIDTLYGKWPELYSIGPLAAIAAGLLPANGAEAFNVLSTDYAGTFAAARVSRALAEK